MWVVVIIVCSFGVASCLFVCSFVCSFIDDDLLVVCLLIRLLLFIVCSFIVCMLHADTNKPCPNNPDEGLAKPSRPVSILEKWFAALCRVQIAIVKQPQQHNNKQLRLPNRSKRQTHNVITSKVPRQQRNIQATEKSSNYKNARATTNDRQNSMTHVLMALM